MEPKVNTIKEESIEKEVMVSTTNSYIDTQSTTTATTASAHTSTRTRLKTGVEKECCKTPDSPEGARYTLSSSSSSSSPTQSLIRPSSSIVSSSITTTTAAAAANGANSPPIYHHLQNGISTDTTTTSSSSISLDSNQLLSRPIIKIKRFFSTLLQFGLDIGPDVGDRVRSLVLSLVSANISVEDFHHSLQDVTNFPLRPFVLPFLKAHLPLLQREVIALARTNKQTPLQYLRAHDHVILESIHSPAEPSEIFLSTNAEPLAAAIPLKRRLTDTTLYENGVNNQHLETSEYNNGIPCKKSFSSQNILFNHNHNHNQSHVSTNPPVFDYSQQQQHHITAPSYYNIMNNNNNNTTRGVVDESRGDEEWRNIHVMLNCILSMVEKTKRALSILQQRNNSHELTNEWLRKQDVSVDLKKAANEIMVQALRQTEDRVAEVKRKSEEAINEVKRQAVIELQKAVTAAEIKANELVVAERAKIEKILIESRKSMTDDSIGPLDSGENSQSPPQSLLHQSNSCWNCGRKAHETCSGCSVARYCGPFCQHKDWENHHQICCNRDKIRPQRTITSTSTTPAANSSSSSIANTTITNTTITTTTTPAIITNTTQDSSQIKK